MSVASAPPPGDVSDAGSPPPAMSGEACPLCGAPLLAEQEWCLRCGAAARTRLAASPNWKAPIAALATVVVVSLGVLAAALVALAGDSGATAPSTTTVTSPLAAAAPARTSTVPGGALPGTSTSGASPSGTSTSGTGSSRTGKAGTSKSGATVPRKVLTPGQTGSSPAAGSGKFHVELSPKIKEEIKRAVEKKLREHQTGKVLPGGGTE